MYKYSCRKCPIRNRCIEQSDYTVSIRSMIRHAFRNRTDTLATWGLLQVNCLLIKAEEEQAKRAQQSSDTLTRRLREARKAREVDSSTDTGELRKDKKSVIRRLPQARKAREQAAQAEEHARQADEESLNISSAQTPDYLQPVSPQARSRTSALSDERRPPTGGLTDPEQAKSPSPFTHSAPPSQKPFWLSIKGSRRHVALPLDGELILGRFDASFGIPPDIDLAFEDRGNHTVSRRHAKIVGWNGRHTIEDTGSSQGVIVNGENIPPGFARQLKAGDRISVGSVQMSYEPMPARLVDLDGMSQLKRQLVVTPTGRTVPIAPPGDIIIGRSDRYVETAPDIDLSEDGEAAARVSRRHASIHWHKDGPHLEDLGSGFGTRINGKMVLLGQSVLLKPGDHIWLGGCVLAYEVEI
jgi:pSer/pThr/pTyr-binding forkhead associated (FHA) protein